jgi:hypothetical protein
MSDDPTPSLLPEREEISSGTIPRWLPAIEVLLILLVFFVYAGWPVPEVNEPHYLGKAKHYWNPAWCQHDFFLETADAHQTFYWCFGWLTLLVPLPVVAWVGRFLTWTLIALGWRRLSFLLVPKPLAAVLSAALFVGLLDRFNLAGEWVVGGIEAKGFAYALVLFAIAEMLLGRWNRVWLLLGAAAAWHVLVGGWSVLAAGFVWLCKGRTRAPLKSHWLGLIGGGLLALVGLAPAVWLTQGADPAIVAQANEIYVFGRLPHHLALHALTTEELQMRVLRNLFPLITFVLLAWLLPRSRGKRRLATFVLATMLMALTGAAISVATWNDPQLAAGLLRYYWYRLYDFALPLGASLFTVALIAQLFTIKRNLATLLLLVVMLFPAGHLGRIVLRRMHDPRAPADRKLTDAADWKAACEWIRAETPQDAIFMTPRGNSTFKWYANRGEVVNHKDIPQDSAGIVEWQSRIDTLYPEVPTEDGTRRKSVGRLSEAELLAAAKKYGAGYLVTRKYIPLQFPVVYKNGTYIVYKLVKGDLEDSN